MHYLFKKILFFLLTAWVALTLNFILPRLMPGDPVTVLMAKLQGRISPEAFTAIKISFGLVSMPNKMNINKFNENIIKAINIKKNSLIEKKEALMHQTKKENTDNKINTTIVNTDEKEEIALDEQSKVEPEIEGDIKIIDLQISQIIDGEKLLFDNYLLDEGKKNYVLKNDLTPEVKTKLLTIFASIGYKKNIVLQYIDYLQRVFTGDFGISISKYPLRVNTVIKAALPWTIGLMGIGVLLAFILGTVTGAFNAWKRESASSGIILIGSLFLQSLPYFWVAILLRFVLGFQFQWFPLYGAYEDKTEGIIKILSILYHGFLPCMVVIIVSIGGWILTMRNNMIGVLSDNYVQFAKAKGITDKDIKYNYAARNAILPSFTGFAMSLGGIMGGQLLTEIVFSYPGIGSLMFEAVQSFDYPLMQACFFLFTMAVLMANFVADLFYIILDPRVRTGGDSK